jgi:hypothetical protein
MTLLGSPWVRVMASPLLRAALKCNRLHGLPAASRPTGSGKTGTTQRWIWLTMAGGPLAAFNMPASVAGIIRPEAKSPACSP